MYSDAVRRFSTLTISGLAPRHRGSVVRVKTQGFQAVIVILMLRDAFELADPQLGHKEGIMSLLPPAVVVMSGVVEDADGACLGFPRRNAPLGALFSFSCRRLFRLANRSSSSESNGTIVASFLSFIDSGAFVFWADSAGQVAWRRGGFEIGGARESASWVVVTL